MRKKILEFFLQSALLLRDIASFGADWAGSTGVYLDWEPYFAKSDLLSLFFDRKGKKNASSFNNSAFRDRVFRKMPRWAAFV